MNADPKAGLPFEFTLSDFDYALPESLIAQHPPRARRDSRLLRVQPTRTPAWSDGQFAELPELLAPGDLLVMNDTRVIKARLFGSKPTGGRIEALVDRIDGEHTAVAMVRASHPPLPGMRLVFRRHGEPTQGSDAAMAQVLSRDGAFCTLRFETPVLEVLDAIGELPLPPYITHTPDADDSDRYQTVYARHEGAVAAPTAGLHFDQAMLDSLSRLGVNVAFVTLHVGAGTFAPVRVDRIEDHVMHRERLHLPESTVAAIEATKAAGRRVVAVGTTSLRALESAAAQRAVDDDGYGKDSGNCSNSHSDRSGSAKGNGRLQAGWQDTQLFIRPGYRFQVVDQLITNFHLPKSTLLMLVSAFIGFDLMKAAYAHAVAQRYRFFSYGDAMLLDRSPTS